MSSGSDSDTNQTATTSPVRKKQKINSRHDEDDETDKLFDNDSEGSMYSDVFDNDRDPYYVDYLNHEPYEPYNKTINIPKTSSENSSRRSYSPVEYDNDRLRQAKPFFRTILQEDELPW